MVAQAQRIIVTPDLQLVNVLEAAQNAPILLEMEGVQYRVTKELSRRPADVVPAGELVAPRGESESLVSYLERVSDAIMQGRRFEVDSTDLINEGREERTRELP